MALLSTSAAAHRSACSIKVFLFCMLVNISCTTGEDLLNNLEIVGSLQTWGIDDGRPAEGSAKHAVWLGDWNGDGIPEYFVATKKGGTSSLFYSTGEGTWQPTSHWYAPSYSVIALDTRGDARPEYIIKTSKFQKNANKTMYEDYVPDQTKRGWTTVFRIPDDPVKNPLEPVMTFDRSVPIVQGCMDIDGDGHKDLLVSHHLENSKFVARYYKGKDDSSDGKPFEATHQWASRGTGSSMGPAGEHTSKARWGDIQIVTVGSTVRKRLFAAGSEGENNNVVYWDYDPVRDTFDQDPTVLYVTMIDASVNNELDLVSVRALPGAIMLAGKNGAFFFKHSPADDTYSLLDVPGITPTEKIDYPEFWCFNSGLNDGKMVFVILRKPAGNRNSAMEFRLFDPSLAPGEQISDILKEIALPPKAQRITALRVDDGFDPMLDVKQLIVAHRHGATILNVATTK